MDKTPSQFLESLSPEQLQQLEQLNVIRLPEPISWWPLAIGWWLLIGFLLLIVAIAVFVVIRHRRSIRTFALQEIKRFPDDNIDYLTVQLSMLIRRFARQRGGSNVGVETLNGSEWAGFLSNNGAMPDDIAQYFADAPYKKTNNPPSAETLKAATEQWIRRHR